MNKFKIIFTYISGYVDGEILLDEDWIILEAISYKEAERKFEKYCTGVIRDVKMM